MARLPGINYSTPVQSLGRQDIYGPIRVANAEAATLAKVSGLAAQYEGIRRGAEHDNALVAFTRASEETNQLVAQYKTRPPTEENAAELADAITVVKDRHRHDLGTHGNRAFDKSWLGFASQKRTEFGVYQTFALNNEARAATELHVDNLARGGDLETSLGLVDSSTMFTETEKAGMRVNAKVAYHSDLVERTGRGGTPEEMQELIARIQDVDGGYTDVFTQSQRNTAVHFLETKHKSSTKTEVAALLHEQERFASDLEVKIRGDEMGGDLIGIERAFDSGKITGAKRTQLILAWQEQEQKRQDMAERASLINQSLENQMPLDRKNPIHKEAVEEAYAARSIIAKQPGLMPREKAIAEHYALDYGMNLAIKTNIMAEEMKGDFRKYAIAGSPERVAQFANAYQNLVREAPQTLDAIGIHESAIYGTVSELNDTGMDLAMAVEIARHNAMIPEREKEVLDERYKAEDNNSNDRLGKKIASATDLLAWTPDASSRMQGSYNALENAYYRRTGGDIERASNLAFQELSRVFSRTDVNGRGQMMAYSPERQTGMTTDELRGQLKTEARKLKVPIDKLVVVPDAQTSRDQDVKSYVLYKIDDFDMLVPVVIDDIPVRWTPDTTAARQVKVDAGRAEHEENVANMQRAARLKAEMREKTLAKEKELGLDKLRQPMRERLATEEEDEFNIPAM